MRQVLEECREHERIFQDLTRRGADHGSSLKRIWRAVKIFKAALHLLQRSWLQLAALPACIGPRAEPHWANLARPPISVGQLPASSHHTVDDSCNKTRLS